METKRLVFESQEDWQKYRGKLFTSSEANRLMAEPTKKAKEAGQKFGIQIKSIFSININYT